MSSLVGYSAFKHFYLEMLAKDGDFSQLRSEIRNKLLKVCVMESTPSFVVSDGHFSIQPHFTKEALESFGKDFPHINFAGLKGQALTIELWSLELHCQETFTSQVNL